MLSDDEQRALHEIERCLAGDGLPGSERGGPVVVGVGERDDGDALDWAAAEASARRSALHVVHVTRPRWAVDLSGLVPVADFWPYRLAAEAVIRDAVSRVRSLVSDLDVSGYVAFGATVPGLVASARGAQLLVVGGRSATHAGRPRLSITPSVSGRVAARASCPVAVVRPLRGNVLDGAPARVVVGVSDSRSSAAAIGFAFAAAAQRGLPLTAVHAWRPDRPADHEAVAGPVSGTEARARSALARALAPWRNELAAVPVEARLVCGDPEVALIRESEGAALVVVGFRGRRFGRTAAHASVSRSVPRRARCPAVVVRLGSAVEDSDARARRWNAALQEIPPGTERFRRRSAPWE